MRPRGARIWTAPRARSSSGPDGGPDHEPVPAQPPHRFQTAADAPTDLTNEAVTHDAISRTNSALNTALDCGPTTPPERRKAWSVSPSILSGTALPDVCKQWLAHAVPPHGGQHKEAQ